MATQQDVVSAWRVEEKVSDELRNYVVPGAFYSNREQFDALVAKLKEANDEYVHVLTELARNT
jgi:hypothetical protein